jgi:glycosyltransferase involved in cell wall biosynthesis
MRIAFILPSLANQGPVLVVKDLIEALQAKGHYCKVFYFDDIIELEINCPATRIRFSDKIPFNDFDVIHPHLFRPDLYCAINKSRIRPSTKLVTTIHTDIYMDLKSAYGFLRGMITPPIWKWAWKKMDRIVVLTNIARQNYERYGISKNMDVINNGRNVPEIFEPISDMDLNLIDVLKDNYTLLGTVAGFDKRKGLEQVMELLKSDSSLAFVIVGDGLERNRLEDIAVSYGIQDRFCILGRRPQGFRYIRQFDLYVMPSRSEGMPLALLEAAASKTPIVCSSIPMFKEMFSTDEVSFFELDHISSFSAACSSALKHRNAFREKAYQKYLAKYSVERMANNYISVYNNINPL